MRVMEWVSRARYEGSRPSDFGKEFLSHGDASFRKAFVAFLLPGLGRAGSGSAQNLISDLKQCGILTTVIRRVSISVSLGLLARQLRIRDILGTSGFFKGLGNQVHFGSTVSLPAVSMKNRLSLQNWTALSFYPLV